MQKPEINYPCRWHYTIIGSGRELIRTAVAEVVGDADHSLELGNISRHGRYVSFRLELTVRDEAHRIGIYQALSEYRFIKIVL